MKIVQGVEIADHAMALLLGLTRRIDRAVESRATETWQRLADFGPLVELHGKTAVIVGVGGIGMQIAVRAKAFGMTVIGVDPKDIPYAPHLDRTVWPDRLDDVLPEADVVFVAARGISNSTRKTFSASPAASRCATPSTSKRVTDAPSRRRVPVPFPSGCQTRFPGGGSFGSIRQACGPRARDRRSVHTRLPIL